MNILEKVVFVKSHVITRLLNSTRAISASIPRPSLRSNSLSLGSFLSLSIVAGYILWRWLHLLQIPFLYFPQIVLGMIIFFIIPGFCVFRVRRNALSIEKLGLALLFGFAVQLLNVEILRITSSTLDWTFELSLALLVLTLMWIFLISLYHEFVGKNQSSKDRREPCVLVHALTPRSHFTSNVSPRRNRVKPVHRNNDKNDASQSLPQAKNKSKQLTVVVILIFIAGLLLRTYYATYNSSSITPDGALYCDMARNLVTSGNFTSLVLNDGLSPNPYYNSLGLNVHPLAWFATALFFMFGNVSLLTANLTVVFAGSLLIVLVYMLTRRIFDEKIGLVCAALVAFHPLFVYFSVILYGPEILSALFMTAALYFLFTGNSIHAQRRRYLLATGLFLGLAELSWFINYYGILPVIFIFYISEMTKLKIKQEKAQKVRIRTAGFLILAFVLLALIVIARRMDSIPVVWFTSTTINLSLISLILLRKERCEPLVNLCYIVLPIIVIFQISLIPIYSVPAAQVQPVIDSVKDLQPMETFLLVFLPGKEISFAYFHRYMESMCISLSPFVMVLAILPFIGIPLTLLPRSKKQSPEKSRDFPGRLKRMFSLLRAAHTCLSNHDRVWIVFLTFLIPASITTIYLPISTIMWGSSMAPRLMLFPALALLISAGIALFYIIFSSRAILERSERSSLILSSLEKKVPRYIISGLTLSLVLVLFFSAMYTENCVEIDSFSIDRYGWRSSLEWVSRNTSPSTVLGTALPRNWAWFANRTTVGIYNFSIPHAHINSSELVTILDTFEVEYLIVDDWFWYLYPNLRNLYSSSLTVGNTIQLQSGYGKSSQTYSLHLVYTTNRVIHNVLIYEVIHTSSME